MDSYNLLVKKSSKEKILLLLFILLFLGTRIWLLGAGIFMSSDIELFNGTIAREILKGGKMPLFDYHADPYAGGTLITGILAVPFFILFGSSYFSLKLVALAFSLGSLIVCFILLNKHFGLKAASFASLLFIFPPTLYAQSSLVSLGNHCESIFFSLLTTLIFFEIFFQKQKIPFEDKKISSFLIFLLGLTSGFSFYFVYTFLYTFLTYSIFWFIFDKRLFIKKYFLIYCLSFVIGFLPWLYYNLTHSFRGLNMIKINYIGIGEKKYLSF